MEYILILITCCTAVFITYYFVDKRNAKVGGKPRLVEKTVEQLLKKMNCPYEKNDRNSDIHMYQFEYQGGHFGIRILTPNKNRSTIRLDFPNFFDTKMNDLHLVRQLCNQMCQDSDGVKFIYSYNEEDNLLHVHISYDVCLVSTIPDLQAHFERSLGQCFAGRQNFNLEFEKLKKMDTEDVERSNWYSDRESLLLQSEEKAHLTTDDANDTQSAQTKAAVTAEKAQEARFMYEDSQDKIAEGHSSELTEEQKFASEAINTRAGENLYLGKQLFLQKKYDEAIVLLESAFEISQPYYDVMSSAQKMNFFDLCFHIGFCYCALHKFQQAYYFLDITIPIHSIPWTMEYVNCLVNSGDFRALQIIDNIYNGIKPDENDEEPEPAIRDFLYFLLRRKAYVLVEKGRLNEAEEIFRPMLEQPENSDFALNELAYIQKLREKKNKNKSE